ncbi:hypothetical protein HZS61_001612 [Fusarium oxysporum f. sp. conglutinans]|uniref:N-acetyltransferase domain-containing protein n=1 Tax=Fusarium oxysporum f. sp. conglutinans TaxID=100902 RepID=A0A8H6LTH7_FUSOX|nr:hypothetical protein HZS61_001612 [Fusarium oxysporum f. sp. conglutinans]
MDPNDSLDDDLYRFSPVTFNDHAGKLWIVTILSLIYTSLIALARAYIKYKMFGFDDVLFAAATVLHLAQALAVFIGLSNGLGKFNSITPPEQWGISSKCTIASVILCLLALSLAKCSVLALIHRIISSKPGKNKMVCVMLMMFTGLWGVGSSLAWLVNCRAGTLLTVNNVKQCPDQSARWGVITAIDILTEILTWLLVLHLSWSVNISFARKCQVVTAFSFRIPLIAISSVHLAYSQTYPSSLEPQFAVTNTLICQQVMIAWSLISATTPNLKNFLKSFSIDLYWLRRARVNFWDYRWKWLVAVAKDKNGNEVIAGIAQWARLGEGGKKFDLWFFDPRNLVKPLSSVAMKIHAWARPSRAVDPKEEDIIERAYPHFDSIWSGKRAESWYLEALAVHPDFQGKNVGRQLVQWGLDQAEVEGVCASVVSALGKDDFYRKCGFDEQFGTAKDGEGNPLADVEGSNIFWKWPESEK